MTTILSNKIKCKHCGDVIESTHVHDFKTCKCGTVSVDGGHEYLKRSFQSDDPDDDFEEFSILKSEELSITLKPCPFCGGEAVLDQDEGDRYYIYCKKCKIVTDYYDSKQETIDIWNRRVVDTTKQQLYDALTAILDVQLHPAFKETLSNALKLIKSIEEVNNG